MAISFRTVAFIPCYLTTLLNNIAHLVWHYIKEAFRGSTYILLCLTIEAYDLVSSFLQINLIVYIRGDSKMGLTLIKTM